MLLFIFFIIILFTHKENIVRLKNSKENKIKL
jgi:glycerol-3-phosphate acyltransferase PlsY